jgi:hypothetical protein
MSDELTAATRSWPLIYACEAGVLTISRLLSQAVALRNKPPNYGHDPWYDSFRVEFVTPSGEIFGRSITGVEVAGLCPRDTSLSIADFIGIIHGTRPVILASADKVQARWTIGGAPRLQVTLRAKQSAPDLQVRRSAQTARITDLETQVAKLEASVAHLTYCRAWEQIGTHRSTTWNTLAWHVLPRPTDLYATELLRTSMLRDPNAIAHAPPLLPPKYLREYTDAATGNTVGREETALHYYIGMLAEFWTIQNSDVVLALIDTLLMLGTAPDRLDNRGDTPLDWLERAEQALQSQQRPAAEARAAMQTTASIRDLLVRVQSLRRKTAVAL